MWRVRRRSVMETLYNACEYTLSWLPQGRLPPCAPHATALCHPTGTYSWTAPAGVTSVSAACMHESTAGTATGMLSVPACAAPTD